MEQRATHTRTYRKLVEGTTINTETLLSTDYLNHFNELIMMLEMVPDMPEMFEEARAWEPKTYQDHFHDSAFTHKDLAIMAYDHAPPEYREPLDQTIVQLNDRIKDGLQKIGVLIEHGEPDLLRIETTSISRGFQELMDRAGAIINGVESEVVETGELVHDEQADGNVMKQDDIDSLFD